MKTAIALLLALASAAAFSAPGAEAAAFKSCGSVRIDGAGKATYRVKGGVSCRAAKKVLRDAAITLCFDNQIPGWEKQWRALPNGGKALTLTKGAKAIKTNACSPK
jgi:hypothetical protein